MKKLLLFLFYFLAIGIGLYPILVFFMPEDQGLLSNKTAELLRNSIWRTAFFTHISLGGIALLAGMTQFSARMRNRNLARHRILGKIYIGACLISGLAGLYIAQFATGGWIPRLGFTSLALFWLITTWTAWRLILIRDTEAHRRWMIRSYALTFAAVTLRLWLPLFTGPFGMDFIPAYQIIAWLSWVPNLVFAEWIWNTRSPLMAST
ncbi:MAG: DUF2306 domain-containing protein [Saprospiraceae bacterium]|nr:DUF2306 domain-containing protein [Saprospiraceae bacterium]